MRYPGFLVALTLLLGLSWSVQGAEDLWVAYPGQEGPGSGKKIVLISGDEEYRSEEALPVLGKILARHGFTCTVLFAIDPPSGEIDPDNQTSIPGLHHLETADLMVLFTRFRELPDRDMKYIVDYTHSGKPIVGLRTATHPFRYTRNKSSRYAKYSFDSPDGGYGRQVFGETWVNHHGLHKKEGTRGLINGSLKDHPILRGVQNIWGPTDVYGVRDLTGSPQVLLYGQVLSGMSPTDPPKRDKSIMPLAWIKDYRGGSGKASRVFFTTMGASVDFENAGLRRLLVNACYWAVGLEDRITAEGNVEHVDRLPPRFFGFGDFKRGMKPSDFRLR